MFTVAILAGGLATRLLPITETIPKALVDVAGKPFIAWQLEYLKEQGVKRVVLCIGYLGHKIREVVGSGELFGLEVCYSEDGPNLLGTGGALSKAIPLLGEDFFVLYGDSFLPLDFMRVQNFYEAREKPALMTIFKNKNQWDKSNVLYLNGRLILYNKRAPRADMSHIDYGLGVVSASVFKKMSVHQAFDLADFYQELSQQGQLAGLEVHERFYEIGSHIGLQETENYFLTREKL